MLTERKSRDTGMDALRLLCMLMLAAYHFINYYGSQYISFANNGIKPELFTE